ncbi:transcription termination factor Rho [Verrucomicrobium spinosum]|uniref:transcription termination factor Rho n=1 Tax=Verrucomicrobium spinosum TaxID=2736 RepID=UPI0009D686E2|nr:transcription termination factor Rho [Verrucomicrobium spinosum]
MHPAPLADTLFPLAPDSARGIGATKKRAAKKAAKPAVRSSSAGSLFSDEPQSAPVVPSTTKKVAAKKASKKTARKVAGEKSPPAPPPLPVEAPAPAKSAAPAKKAAKARATAAKTPKAPRSEASAPEPGPAPVSVPAPAPKPVVAPPVVEYAPPAAPISAPAPAPSAQSAPVAGPAPASAHEGASHPQFQPRPQQPPQEYSRNQQYGRRHQSKYPQPRHSQHGASHGGEGQYRENAGESQSQGESRENQAYAPGPHPGQGQGHGQDQREHRQGGKWNKRERFKDRFRNKPRHGQDGHPGDAPQPIQPAPERPLGPPEPSEGILEMTPKGYGFLRQKSRLFAQYAQDPWVSPEFVRNLGLREGMFIKGIHREGHRGPQVTEITEVNGLEPEKVRNLPLFEELKAINPNKRIQLETRPDRLTTRIMDLITPVGRGQRGLIVAPPRAGKTTLLQHIAEAVVQNHPQMHLMILLVDERPEEVTEFRRALPTAEIHASSNDSDMKSHLRTALFAIERAKRLVEAGQHVFMLLDSITRMGRAFNNAQKHGATMSGGVGVGALEVPRRLFAAARNTRDAGSLTILATTLIETNSRMDELIFQEFKGTGNLELVLDRKIAEQYIYPAVNIFRSGTRREELLLPAFQMEKVHLLRRGLAGHKPMEAIQRVISLMERFPNNAQMLVELPGRTS